MNISGVLLRTLLLIFCIKTNSGQTISGENCIRCLCHAVSGCWNIKNCANYSMNETYWRDAGSPTVDGRSSTDGFRKCMNDETCIVKTIKMFTDKYLRDCNCDEEIDCKDRYYLHLSMGKQCLNPAFANRLNARRFNNCGKNIGVNLMEIDEAPCERENII